MNRGQNSGVGNVHQNRDSLGKATETVKRFSSLKDLKGKDLVDIAKNVASYLAEGVTSTQMRKFHEHIVRFVVKAMAGKEKISDIYLMNYYFAYETGRLSGRTKDLMGKYRSFMEIVTEKVQEESDLLRLRQLSEAIVAYHKLDARR